jgi:voltage-gated potassium channel
MVQLTALCTRWRYLVLLGTLLLLLVVQPVSFGLSTSPQWIDALLVLVTVALLLSFCADKHKRLVAIAFGLPIGLLLLGGHMLADQARHTVVMIAHGLAVAFYAWAAVLIIASLLRRHALSLDTVFGAICGYLLLGMAWGVLYSMLDTGWPGSFEVGDRLAEEVKTGDSRIPLFTYYSFITLTTVGYGDVTPVSAPARTCAWLEALTGQFYMAVLVAGLVGALLATKSDRKEIE